MAVFTRFSGGFCILRVCVAPAAPSPLWAVPGPPGHEKRTPTAADAHDLKIVVKLRAVPASKVPFPVEIAGFPDFSRPVPVYPAFLKYVVPVHFGQFIIYSSIFSQGRVLCSFIERVRRSGDAIRTEKTGGVAGRKKQCQNAPEHALPRRSPWGTAAKRATPVRPFLTLP